MSMNSKNRVIIRGAAILIGVIALALALTCSPRAERELPLREDPQHPGRFLLRFEAMGTEGSLLVCAPDQKVASKMVARGMRQITAVEKRMSTYLPDSEISRLNRLGAQQPVELSVQTRDVLRRSVEFSKLSGGAFDVTYAPLRTLWQKAQREGAVPTQEQIADALRAVGSDKLVLSGQTARFASLGMQVDLGGIAKGFAIDLAAEAMMEVGASSGLVEIGGDMRVIGHREDGQKWKIQLKDPRPGDRLPIYLRLADAAVATSGDYARYYSIGPQRFSHIIDPRTGWPVQDVPSATVTAPDATTADALATAISVLGPKEAVALVNSLEGVECMVMAQAGGTEPEIYYSDGFDALMETQNP